VAGWVAVEQAFVIAENPGLRARYPVESLFEAAQDSFTLALDRYDEHIDPPDHLRKIELAMGALSLYQVWVEQQEATPQMVKDFNSEVVAIGNHVMGLRQENSWDSYTTNRFSGFASELVTILGYNRRQQDAPAASLSFAVPSTFRQNLSRRPGSSGSRYDRTKLRGNWDVSIVGRSAGKLTLTDKLQVKTALSNQTKPDRPRHRDAQQDYTEQDYTEDVTVVAVKDHICRGLTLDAPVNWAALQALLEASEPTSRKQKTTAVAVSRGLYSHIEMSREERARLGGQTPHSYVGSVRPKSAHRPPK
jgi:hypothetical protein